MMNSTNISISTGNSRPLTEEKNEYSLGNKNVDDENSSRNENVVNEVSCLASTVTNNPSCFYFKIIKIKTKNKSAQDLICCLTD